MLSDSAAHMYAGACTAHEKMRLVGPSWLGALKYDDLIRGTSIDYYALLFAWGCTASSELVVKVK